MKKRRQVSLEMTIDDHLPSNYTYKMTAMFISKQILTKIFLDCMVFTLLLG